MRSWWVMDFNHRPAKQTTASQIYIMTYRGEIMAKRQLSSKYKDLVNYVKNLKGRKWVLSYILKTAIEESVKGDDEDDELWQILEGLYVTVLTDIEVTDLVETIIDIYNDNYELEEPLYYWKLKMSGLMGGNLYVFKFIASNGVIGITPKYDEADKLAKNELIEMLANTDTNLTIDNFTPVEEL